MQRIALTLLAVLAAAAVTGGALLYSGVFSVAADERHWAVTERLLEIARSRSIARRVADIRPPELADPQLVLAGAVHYAEMCAGCHLAPGAGDTEIRQGLSPPPPNLSERKVDPRTAFWVIKHGIKMSAMPAWGVTHDDAAIWSLVAFIGRLPALAPQEYQELTAKSIRHGMPAGSPEQAPKDPPHSHPHSHATPHAK